MKAQNGNPGRAHRLRNSIKYPRISYLAIYSKMNKNTIFRDRTKFLPPKSKEQAPRITPLTRAPHQDGPLKLKQ